jgi:hypothetical protein
LIGFRTTRAKELKDGNGFIRGFKLAIQFRSGFLAGGEFHLFDGVLRAHRFELLRFFDKGAVDFTHEEIVLTIRGTSERAREKVRLAVV